MFSTSKKSKITEFEYYQERNDIVGGRSFNEEGIKFYKKRNYDKAIEKFEEALQEERGLSGANSLFYLSDIHLHRGDLQKAGEYIDRCIFIRESKAFGSKILLETYQKALEIYSQKGDHKQILSIYDKSQDLAKTHLNKEEFLKFRKDYVLSVIQSPKNPNNGGNYSDFEFFNEMFPNNNDNVDLRLTFLEVILLMPRDHNIYKRNNGIKFEAFLSETKNIFQGRSNINNSQKDEFSQRIEQIDSKNPGVRSFSAFKFLQNLQSTSR